MGYFTTNFIPLNINGCIASLSLTILCILVIYLRKMTRENYQSRIVRLVGVYLPDQNLFRRIVFRIFVVFYLQILMTSILGIIVINDIKKEFPAKCLREEGETNFWCWGLNKDGEMRTVINGISALLSLTLVIIVVPVVAHMVFVITTYFKEL